MTTSEVYTDFKNQLQAVYDTREADNIADWVFENITGLERWERKKNYEISNGSYHKLIKHLDELLKHKPVQYVLNEAWFYKRKFYVDENVLIPRPETEELVEWIVADVRDRISDVRCNGIEIIDIGTGSGCIPISLKKEMPELNVTAIDLSENALSVAKKNANNLNAAIDFFQIDFLNEDEWQSFLQYDIIVSNPPYIPISEKEALAKNVTDFEPGIALFVAENDPFIFYKTIAEFSKSHLHKGGKIYVEVHEEYAKEVKKIFDSTGFPSVIKKDIFGKERMVRGKKV